MSTHTRWLPLRSRNFKYTAGRTYHRRTNTANRLNNKRLKVNVDFGRQKRRDHRHHNRRTLWLRRDRKRVFLPLAFHVLPSIVCAVDEKLSTTLGLRLCVYVGPNCAKQGTRSLLPSRQFHSSTYGIMAATCFAARLVFCVVVCAIGVIAGEFGGNFYPDSDFIDLISRDIESLPGPMAFGHKYITGGAGEGDQQLHPDGDFESRQDVKSDNVLPAYCEPPNPCPVGYSAQDGCLENFENTADFSRNYQAQQECLCDHEHMFNCPTKDKDGYENEMNEMLDRNGLHKNMIAKKFHEKRSDNEEPRRKKRSAGFQKPQTRSNPYLNGEPLHTVSKKNGRHLY